MNNQIHQKWREALNQPVPEWDQAGTWEKIEQSLPQDNPHASNSLSKWMVLIILCVTLWGDLYHNKLIINSITPNQAHNNTDGSLQATNTMPNGHVQTASNKSIKKDTKLSVTLSHARTQQSAKHSTTPLSTLPLVLPTGEAADALPQFDKQLLSGSFDSLLNLWQYQRTSLSQVQPFTQLNLSELLLPFLPTWETANVTSTHQTLAITVTSQQKKRHDSRWALIINCGIAFTQLQLQATDAQGENFRLAKKSTETTLETTSLSGNMALELHRNWQLYIGVEHQRIAHWFRAKQVSVEQQQIMSDSAMFYQLNGNTVYVNGQVNQQVITTETIQSPTAFNRIFIPLALGYQHQRGRHAIVVQIGAMLNVWNRYQGFSLDETGQIIRKDRQQLARIYRKNGAHSVRVTGTYSYYLNQRWQLSAGVAAQTDWRSVFTPVTQLNGRYQQLGIQLGMNYRIGR
jgi:hypothetical protein